MIITYDNFFEQQIVLENDIVRIEPLEQKHFEYLLPVALNDNLWHNALTKIATGDDFMKYFNRAIEERQTKKSYPFVYFDKANNKYAGCTRFMNIEFMHKRLEIGSTWLDEKLHGTGFNKHCKFLLLSFGFDKLNLNRIELKTNKLNLRSQKAMRKIGAVEEGTFRSHCINDDGTIRDSVFFSFIKPEWEQTKQQYFKEFAGK